MTTQLVNIALGDRSYDIAIAGGLLDSPTAWQGLPKAGAALIVTNDTVAPLYLARLQHSLASHYPLIHVCSLPDGESYKTWDSLNQIFDVLLGKACDRKTVLFALGGGVIGDITGFAAACYMRGVPFVQVPTTLLAQVDSSVGGKTAINHPIGKNMIGAFYQPERVVCDLGTLQTLAPRELSAGLAEVIKYGPIADMAFLDWIEQHMHELLSRDPQALAHAVKRSCEIKAWVVGQDEREAGIRAILNFGHTFGHAIEAGMGYGEWLHGEAVGCGMVLGADLSCRLGHITQVEVDRLTKIIQSMSLPIKPPKFGAVRYMELMQVDKKTEGGTIRYVLLEKIGKAQIKSVADATVLETLKATGAA